jgi:predicted ribosomally synthesized peptide with SipW-like signal peptide
MKRKNLRRALTILILLIVAAGLTVLSTGANFADQESSTGTITSGELNLTIDGKNTTVKSFDIVGLIPGGSGSGSMTLKNEGTVSGSLRISNVTLSQNGGTTNDSEKEVDPDNDGNLGELLTITVTRGSTVVYTGTLSGINGFSGDSVNMNPSDTVVYDVSFSWPSSDNDDAG